MQLSEAFDKVRSLQFAEALQCYSSILHQNPHQAEALEGSHLAAKWNSVWRQCGDFSRPEDVELVYLEMHESKANCGMSPSFKEALLHKVTREMQRLEMHFLEDGTALGDLFLQLKESAPAEQEFAHYLNATPQQPYWLMQLGNSQYLQHKQRPPGVNFTMALLCGLSANDYPQILLPGLRKYLTEKKPKHPAVMAWIMGFLPLLQTNDLKLYLATEKEKIAREIALYKLVMAAENHRKGHSKPLLAARKNLQKTSPEVFQAYLKKLEHGR